MALPQTPIELVTVYLDWAEKNINNNLGFIPADKFDWKPAPESKSALEIVNHATGTVHMFTSAITGDKTELTPATDAATSKALFTQVIQAHKSAISALTPEDMERVVTLPIGDMPIGMIASMPVVELVNHHGQFTYIETLLGDSESHLIFS